MLSYQYFYICKYNIIFTNILASNKILRLNQKNIIRFL